MSVRQQGLAVGRSSNVTGEKKGKKKIPVEGNQGIYLWGSHKGPSVRASAVAPAMKWWEREA
jgi:hypothetical protein